MKDWSLMQQVSASKAIAPYILNKEKLVND